MASVVPDLQRVYCSTWRLSDLLPETLKLLSSLNINSVHGTQKQRKGQVKGQSQNGGVLHVDQVNMPTSFLIIKIWG